MWIISYVSQILDRAIGRASMYNGQVQLRIFLDKIHSPWNLTWYQIWLGFQSCVSRVRCIRSLNASTFLEELPNSYLEYFVSFSIFSFTRIVLVIFKVSYQPANKGTITIINRCKSRVTRVACSRCILVRVRNVERSKRRLRGRPYWEHEVTSARTRCIRDSRFPRQLDRI